MMRLETMVMDADRYPPGSQRIRPLKAMVVRDKYRDW
jgi:hypothetical protein